MRKIWIEERQKPDFDDLPLKEIRNMCGYIWPKQLVETPDNQLGEKLVWEVTTLYEGEGMTCDSQEMATLIAQNEMMLGLLLKGKKR